MALDCDMDFPSQNPNIQPGEPLQVEPSPALQTRPISKLPPEIISEVFLNFLPAYPERPEHPGLSSPLLLCAICREWRAIAIATPELWRAVRMAVDSSSRVELVELAAQFELLQIWLSRSGSYPLSLDIPFQSRSSTFLLEERLLQIAVPHSERWEHVDLCLMFDNVHFLQRNMPLLRHLTFGLHQYPPKDKPVNLFDRAPRLTHVVLTSNFVKSVIDLPWHQLTHLCAHFLYIEECAEILRDAVNLVHCDFGICGSEYSIPLSTLPVHPHLTHLVLRLTGATSYRPHLSLSPFFDNLTMPALLSLRVYEPGITLDALEGSFWRSRCSLEELRIDEASEPESTYHEAFPSVKRILLYGQQGD